MQNLVQKALRTMSAHGLARPFASSLFHLAAMLLPRRFSLPGRFSLGSEGGGNLDLMVLYH